MQKYLRLHYIGTTPFMYRDETVCGVLGCDFEEVRCRDRCGNWKVSLHFVAILSAENDFSGSRHAIISSYTDYLNAPALSL